MREKQEDMERTFQVGKRFFNMISNIRYITESHTTKKDFFKGDGQRRPFHKISFEPLSSDYFKVMHKWFNTKHVQKFYSLRDWTLSEIVHKYTLVIHSQTKPIQGFIIYLQDTPIGYIQCYAVADYPWIDQKLSKEIIQNAAGVDLFMGEKDILRKGIALCALDMFLTLYVWTKFTYLVVDPDVDNITSQNFFKKLGFKDHRIIDTKDVLGRKVRLQLMIKKNVGNCS